MFVSITSKKNTTCISITFLTKQITAKCSSLTLTIYALIITCTWISVITRVMAFLGPRIGGKVWVTPLQGKTRKLAQVQLIIIIVIVVVVVVVVIIISKTIRCWLV